MDEGVRLVLTELQQLRRDLDTFDGRITALERNVVPWRYSVPGVTRQRRLTVVRMREAGLSIGAIAAALGLGRSTVERDLQCTPHETPERIVGLDKKSHPAVKNGRGGEAMSGEPR